MIHKATGLTDGGWRVFALRVKQREDVPLYVFGVNGRLVQQFAAVDHADRDAKGVLAGYQRPHIKRHIAEIYSYLSTDGAILPNAIVVAFGETIRFEALPGVTASEWGTPGILNIPLQKHGEPKPAFIVDGQQRAAALADLQPDRNFPVVVVGFQTDSEVFQREQFVLVNKTKPLPRDLLNELLPHVGAELPGPWRLRRVSARVLEILRFDKASPFLGRVRGVGERDSSVANISQASVLVVIEESIKRGGILADHYSPSASESKVSTMASIVSVYFQGVQSVWPREWSLAPRESRLVHGTGLFALGALMDIMLIDLLGHEERDIVKSVERRLSSIESHCAWTSGRWHALDCAWNGLQNTVQDKKRLANFLIQEYRSQSRP